MRVMDAEDEEGKPAAWIVYGHCKKCKVVMVSSIFIQPEKPEEGADFIIDWSKKSGKGNEWK